VTLAETADFRRWLTVEFAISAGRVKKGYALIIDTRFLDSLEMTTLFLSVSM
jgi:hypothetical protein